MVLHISLDDKFIDMAYRTFENVNPNKNEFIIVTHCNEFSYVKSTPITRISRRKFLSRKYAEECCAKYESIVIHWLDEDKKQFILNCTKTIKIIWIGWGGDYYSYINKELLLKKTKKLWSEKKSTISLKERLKNIIWENILGYKLANIINVLERIDYFSPVLEQDYKFVKNSFPSTKFPKYIDWNYGTLEDDLITEDLCISGNNILLGNSATYENNHIEALDLVENLFLGDRRVIVPLSYGNDKYKDLIINYGSETLGVNFKPLTEFVNINEYNKVISTCSVVIMNHIRQQALGSIIIMIYFGAKIFLNKQNPIYEFFIRQGAIIFSIEDLNDININIGLSEPEKDINKKIIMNHWNKEVIYSKTENLLKALTKGTNA